MKQYEQGIQLRDPSTQARVLPVCLSPDATAVPCHTPDNFVLNVHIFPTLHFPHLPVATKGKKIGINRCHWVSSPGPDVRLLMGNCL